MTSLFSRWMPFAVTITIVCGLVFVTQQQELRMSANDLPRQLAIDAATDLQNGMSPQAATGQQKKIDMAVSLSPFLIIVDDAGHVLASSATLYGKTPALPAGVVQYVKDHGADRITWQPAPDVRNATVAVFVNGTKPMEVFAGQSMLQTETHIGLILAQVFFAWIAGLACTLVALLLFRPKHS